jgi:poly(3-hydroxyalkanoate) depolymerase
LTTIRPPAPGTSIIRVGNASLRVAVRGQGPPLLLLSGIGASIEMWQPFESLIRGSTTISLDLPGAGKSPRTGAPVRMRALASIVGGVLDALGYPRVDVLGYSFGGAVAQQLAHDAPGRVRRLVLAATTCGLGGRVAGTNNFLLMLTPARYYSRRYFQAIGPGLYGGRSRDVGVLDEHFRQRSLSPPSWLGYTMQMYSIWGWSSRAWLHTLEQPTLVISGDDDPLVPVENSYLLAAHIPDARLRIVQGAGHLFLIDQPEEPAAIVTRFLRARRAAGSRSSPGRQTPAAPTSLSR